VTVDLSARDRRPWPGPLLAGSLNIVDDAVHRTEDLALSMLHSRLGAALDGQLCELRFEGRRSHRLVVVPALYARDGDRVVVLAGRAWWHHFSRPLPVTVDIGDRTLQGHGRAVPPGSPHRGEALRIYRRCHPDAHFSGDDRLVVITLAPATP